MAERIVYLHGVPESGDMWRPFVERTGGDTPDMPGFGRSDKPASGELFMGLSSKWAMRLLAERQSETRVPEAVLKIPTSTRSSLTRTRKRSAGSPRSRSWRTPGIGLGTRSRWSSTGSHRS